ncbi:WD40 repeat-like protein [Ramicandelaber brevisporus]|nr:WD40 repeat-like protein [Ramicandelaber brevisporus]
MASSNSHANGAVSGHHDQQNESDRVQVIFTSRNPEYQAKLPNQPFFIDTSFKRLDLSELANALLKHDGMDEDKKVVFDFLIDDGTGGALLTKSIGHFLRKTGSSVENVLTLECIEATLPPEPKMTSDNKAWISSIAINSETKRILVGGFDGTARVWNFSNTCEATLEHNRDTVNVAEAVPQFKLNQLLSSEENYAQMMEQVNSRGPFSVKAAQWATPKYALTGGLDTKIVQWQFTENSVNGQLEEERVCEFVGHFDAVNSICVDTRGARMLSSSNDGTVKLWRVPLSEAALSATEGDGIIPATAQSDASGPAAKKRRQNAQQKDQKPIQRREALVSFGEQKDIITCAIFDGKSPNTIFHSGGMDRSLRTWDMTSRDNIDTRLCDTAFLALDASPATNLLASGHAEPTVRVWDVRTSPAAHTGDANAVRLTLAKGGHRNWVTKVKWSPTSEHILASTSHDGNICIWDIRAPRAALFNVPATDKARRKVFAMDWNGDYIVSGGEEAILRTHSFNAVTNNAK